MAIAVLALVAGCSLDDPVLDPDPATLPVVVGSGDSTYSELIAEIYAGALARGGSTVEVQAHLGDRAATLAALDSGKVTLIPELTGSFLAYLNPAATQSKPDDVRDALSKALPAGLSISDYAGAQHRSVFIVGESTAARSVGDLRCGELTLGSSRPVPAVVIDRLRTEYSCEFRQVSSKAEGSREGTDVGVQEPGVGFSKGVIALTDDKYAFAAENVVPVFRTGSLTQKQITKLNVVAGELTTDNLSDLLADANRGASVADLARTWLDQHGL
nr:glycine betaine ABC transporter substrate-binding protein [Antrihabitans stalactiti]